MKKIIALIILSALCISSLSACQRPEPKMDFIPEPVVYTHELPPTVYLINDVRYIGEPTNDEDFNDMVRLYTTLQGRLNKKAKENNFYVYQMFDSQDKFWLDYMMSEGKMLENAQTVELNTWEDIWNAFGSYIIESGIVLWDPDAPATSNVASTICSVEGYLPVRYDTDPDSMYTWLTSNSVEVKFSLVDMFTGELGTKIADTDIDSSGSIKCDPYLWAMEKYLDKTNDSLIAYTLDGAPAVETNPVYIKTTEGRTPNVNQLYSHDYFIYNECFFFDLTCVADESPCDDPTQPIGTDAETLHKILSRFSSKDVGNMKYLIGFPPWYVKYTVFNNNGKTKEVDLEWAFTEVLSSYDIVKEADAAHPSWMTNASVYCQYESTVEEYVNNDPPQKKEFDENTRYFTLYLGDYDSSAWLKLMVPDCFTSDQRGQIPMMWAFNPNLSQRVPMIFDYIYENKTANDFFITGNSGAGYVMPTMLEDLNMWTEYSSKYMNKFDMDIVGFIINKKNITLREFEAYTEISPYGSFHNDHDHFITVLNDKHVYTALSDIYPYEGEKCYEEMYNRFSDGSPESSNFAAFRTIRQYTHDIVNVVNNFIEYAEAKNDGYKYEYVDMYTYFDLVLQSGQGKYIYSKNN
ncbi:MAG: hypothetical protein IJE40_04745, partial [Clostridia bacterium]|nr:hypothetical protein [Clostridia bacterium]